ncbi:recombinase family protein [Mesorhizobium silamurunense]|uniref:recombinase family protein n=1 Tax=Mesorhizobium silamurunense TaxID=499528 RepID=UPI001FECB65B|nr:recombinase family protein [Mesorhizobium silamurunense]
MSYATVHRIIENPIYGGAYAYGKSGVAPGFMVKKHIRGRKWLEQEKNVPRRSRVVSRALG